MDREAALAQKTGLARALLRNFVVYNPLFFVSAMLILVGAGLLNPPDSSGGRTAALLAKVFATIELYQALLLGAGWILGRRADLERDLRLLLLTLAPFLLDITMTTSSLEVSLIRELDKTPSNATGEVEVDMLPAYALAALAAVLLGAKAYAAARLAKSRFEPGAWAALLAAPLLVIAFPLVAHRLALSGHLSEKVGLAGGALLAGLVLLLGLTVERREIEWGELLSRLARGVDPRDTRRLLVGIALVGAAVHLGATTWSNGGELLHVLGPLLIALGPLLSRLVGTPAERNAPFVLPAIGALLCGVGKGSLLGVDGWHLGLGGLAFVHGTLLVTTRSPRFFLGVFLAADLACGGSTPRASLDGLGGNVLEPLALLALAGEGIARRRSAPAVLFPLAFAALLVENREPFGSHLAWVAASEVLGLGILAWTHRVHGRGAAGARWRLAASLLVYLPACVAALTKGRADEVALAARFAAGSVVFLLALAAVARVRVYAIPSLLLVGKLGGQVAPETAAGWGVLGIGTAFVLVGLGVWVSWKRAALLAWLDAGAGEGRASREEVRDRALERPLTASPPS